MLVTYCDSCGILVRHPKVEVKVHCPACYEHQMAMAARTVPAPLPYAERMHEIGGDPLVQETARCFRKLKPLSLASR